MLVFCVRVFLRKLAEHRLYKSEAGVTAIEYALIAGITVMAVVVATTSIGTTLSGIFGSLLGAFHH